VPDAEHHVVYKAIADFSSLYAEVAKAKAALRAIKEEARSTNLGGVTRAAGTASPTRSGTTSGAGSAERTRATTEERALTQAVREHATAAEADAKATDRQRTSHQQLALFTKTLAKDLSTAELKRREAARASGQYAESLEKETRATRRRGDAEGQLSLFSRRSVDAARQARDARAQANRELEKERSLLGSIAAYARDLNREEERLRVAAPGAPGAPSTPGSRDRQAATSATDRQADIRARAARAAELAEARIAALRAKAAHDAELAEARTAATRSKTLHDAELAEVRTAATRQRAEDATATAAERQAATRAKAERDAELGEERIAAARQRSAAAASAAAERERQARARATRDAELGEERLAAARQRAEAAAELSEERLRQARARTVRDAELGEERLRQARARTERDSLLGEERLQQSRDAGTRKWAADYAKIRNTVQAGYRADETAEARLAGIRDANNRRRVIDEERISALREAAARRATAAASRGGGRTLADDIPDASRIAASNRALADHARAHDTAGTATRRSIHNSEDYVRAFRTQIETLRIKRGALTEHGRVHQLIAPLTQRATALSRSFAAAIRGGTRDLNDFKRTASSGGSAAAFFAGFNRAGEQVSSLIQGMLRHLFSFRTLIAAAVFALGPLVAILGALGGAAIGAANALISMSGVVAALPGLFAAAGTGIAALIVGVLPLTAAFKAFSANQKAAATGAKELADAQAAAADRLRSAERSYRSAVKDLADSQYQAKRAQVDLNQARRDALRDLQDLRAELEHSALDEQGAILAVKEAEDQYRRTLADPNATLLDRQEALLRIKQAEQDLTDVRRKNQRVAEDAALAEQRGVEGSERVVDAKRAEYDAQYNLVQASERLKDATIDLNKARAENAAGGTQQLKTQQALSDALAKLGPNTRRVAEFLFGLNSAWKALQRNVSEALFAPIVGQLGNLKSLLPIVNLLLSSAAGAIGSVAAKGIAMLSSGPWKSDFATIAKNNATLITIFGDAGLYVAQAFKDIAIAAAPFTTWLAGAIRNVAKGFAEWAAHARGDGSLARFLDDTKDRLSVVWQIIKNLGGVVASLYTASKDFTTWMLDGLQRMTKGWRDVAKEQEKPGSGFRKYLEDIKPLLSSIKDFLGAVAKAFAELASNPAHLQEAQRILAILADKILPKLVTFFEELSKNGTIGDILDAVAVALDALNAVVERMSGRPLAIIVWFLKEVANFWKFAMENPVLGTILSGIFVAMAAFVGAAAFAKLTGLFAIWNFFKWIIAGGPAVIEFFKKAWGFLSRKPDLSTYSTGIDNDIPGGDKVRNVGTYTQQLNTIIGLLRGIEACVCKETPCTCKSTGATGAAGEDAAAGALRGSAVALDGAAAQLTLAARALTVSAALPAGPTRALPGATRALPGATRALPGGVMAGEAGAAGAGAAGAAERTVIDAAQRRTWWQRLLGRPATPGTPYTYNLPGEAAQAGRFSRFLGNAGEAVGTAGRYGRIAGRFGGQVAAPLLAVEGAANSGSAIYDLITNRRNARQNPLSYATALSGGTADIVLPAVSAIGGNLISKLFPKGSTGASKDFWSVENLQKHMENFGAEAPGVAKNFLKIVEKMFSSLGDTITKSKPVQWIDKHLVKPVTRFFSSIGGWIEDKAHWAQQAILKAFGPFVAIFLGISDFVTDIEKKSGRALQGIAEWLGGLGDWARGVVDQYVIQPFLDGWKTFKGWIDSLFSSIAGSDLVQGFLDRFKHGWQLFTGWVDAAWSAVSGLAKTYLVDGFVRGWNMFRGWVSSAWGAVSGLAKTYLLDPFLRGWATFKGWLDAVWTSLINTIKSLPTAILLAAEALPLVGSYIKARAVAMGIQPSLAGATAHTLPGHQSGGVVEGTYDGRTDTVNRRLTIGEFVTRKRVVDKPGGKQLLRALNDELFDPATVFAALNHAAASVHIPAQSPARVRAASAVVNNTTNNDNTRNAGLSIGDITINNPVREQSSRSLRRSLHTLAYMSER